MRIARTEIVAADLFRLISKTEGASADTFRRLGSGESISGDTNRAVACSESTTADSFRRVANAEKFSARLTRNLREYVRADCFRKIVRTEKTVASTVIRVPYILNYVISQRFRALKAKSLSAGAISLVNTFKDCWVTAGNITLSERTLSDDFTFDIARPMEINEVVKGNLLDYAFAFLVEETSQTDLVQSVKGRYNVDDLLYTQIFIPSVKISEGEYETEIVGARWTKYISGNNNYCYPRATEVMEVVAGALGLALDIRIDDFTPYNLSADNRVTYADIIATMFSWTSRLPQRQVNVFIRGGVLHCIQRGKEGNIFDITNLSYSRPTVKKKLIRSLWNNPRYDDEDTGISGSSGSLSSSGSSVDDSIVEYLYDEYQEKKLIRSLWNNPRYDDEDTGISGSLGSSSSSGSSVDDPIVEYLYDEYQEPFSGTIIFSSDNFFIELKYSIGLLMKETQEHNNSRGNFSSTTYYVYEEKFPSGMNEISIQLNKSWNKNFYGDFYLIQKKAYSSARKIEEKSVVETKQSSTTSYNYTQTQGDEVYLVSEIEETSTYTYRDNKLEDSDEDYRETYHVPIGNGWYGQTVYRNGELQGSNISQGTPGNKVSQYMIGEVQKAFKGWTVTYEKPNKATDKSSSPISGDSSIGGGDELQARYDDWRKNLAPIADTSFPVRELDLLRRLTEDLLWLNRKVEETITIDLIATINNGVPDITHIVDFTERVRFNGAEYFLVSNNITFTPRKLIQKLTLIRWY